MVSLKTNKDYSTIFEIAPKYCILDSFVDYEGYSISSKGFLPTRARPSFPHSQSIPPGSFHKPFILIFQRQTDWKPQLQETNQTSHGSQPCQTHWNYEPCRVGSPETNGPWQRVLTKHGPLEKGMANHSVFLPWEPHKLYEKAKRYDIERCTPQVSRCPICYWRKVEK